MMTRAPMLLATMLVALGGCAATPADSGPSASAALQPTAGNSAAGNVRFVQQADAIVVTAKVSGLKPGQLHGFHIHEKGDCSSPDATSAGGHYNPSSKPHGAPDADHHAGDLPALHADASGSAMATFRIAGVGIGSGNNIVGRGLIVHAQPDDYKTQPTGNSGARIACGVIVADSAK